MQHSFRKNRPVLMLLVILFASFIHTAPAPAAQASEGNSLAQRISRIENGLLPASVIKGQPLPALSVAERMRHFHVPGLSAAFIDHGKIAWVRAYGYADVASGRPVTPDTLFQAASISKPLTAVAAMRLVQSGQCKGRVGSDDDGLLPSLVAINDGQEDLLPPVGTVDVARPKLGREAVALWAEDEERVVADGLKAAVVRGPLLRPVDRALGAVDIERHPPVR